MFRDFKYSIFSMYHVLFHVCVEIKQSEANSKSGAAQKMAMAEFNKEGDVNSQRPSVCEFESFFTKVAELKLMSLRYPLKWHVMLLNWYLIPRPPPAKLNGILLLSTGFVCLSLKLVNLLS